MLTSWDIHGNAHDLNRCTNVDGSSLLLYVIHLGSVSMLGLISSDVNE